MDDRLYFRQLLSGRDIAVGDPIAHQMVNFVYLIGDKETREALVVDPAYGVQDILDIAAADDMAVTGVLATHFHADHIGGNVFGMTIEGVRELLEIQDTKIHVQKEEVPWVLRAAELPEDALVAHDSGDVVEVGEVKARLIHTPGHTPGSQCFYVEGNLVAGDTLFLEGCGRTDLPGGDPRALYESLTQRLAAIPDDTILFPGHLYSAEAFRDMGTTRRLNYVFKPKTEQQWLAMFGA